MLAAPLRDFPFISHFVFILFPQREWVGFRVRSLLIKCISKKSKPIFFFLILEAPITTTIYAVICCSYRLFLVHRVDDYGAISIDIAAALETNRSLVCLLYLLLYMHALGGFFFCLQIFTSSQISDNFQVHIILHGDFVLTARDSLGCQVVTVSFLSNVEAPFAR